ncbi:ABC transporter permease [Pseudolysinimonas yzui]|uniref:Sugar ABC transporter permease n=1 Tax=Pseudolysinimonas yzui TaxID=2708254 RepID=A0A8J3GR14_9MICO|nr:ABC transporter permease [Pseudolysinimonas yzui]GHF19080.1 sugar ABC transporter permease [Pseudolysinimonas yzui]
MSQPVTSRRTPVAEWGERLGLPILLAVIVLFFSVFPASSRAFFSVANLTIVLANQSIIMLVAIALMFPLIAGHFDFSVGAMTVLAAVVCAGTNAQMGLPIAVSILLAIGVGLAVGLANGVLVARLGLNSFVSTLGAATLIGGLIQWYTAGQAIIGIDPALLQFGSRQWLGVPRVLFIVIVVGFAAWYILGHTPFGRSLYAIGSNPRSADLVGLPRMRYTLFAFAMSGLIAGIAGVALTARTGGANPDGGTFLLFPALAAVFLGATAIIPGRFNVVGTVIGVLFVAVSVSGLTLAGAQSWVDAVFNGAALIIAVFVSSVLRKRRAGS